MSNSAQIAATPQGRVLARVGTLGQRPSNLYGCSNLVTTGSSHDLAPAVHEE